MRPTSNSGPPLRPPKGLWEAFSTSSLHFGISPSKFLPFLFPHRFSRCILFSPPKPGLKQTRFCFGMAEPVRYPPPSLKSPVFFFLKSFFLFLTPLLLFLLAACPGKRGDSPRYKGQAPQVERSHLSCLSHTVSDVNGSFLSAFRLVFSSLTLGPWFFVVVVSSTLSLRNVPF